MATRFEELAITSFLDVDPRPTVVLDLQLPPAGLHITYRNPAFQSIDLGPDEEIATWIIGERYEETHNVPAAWRDRSGSQWVTVVVQERWILSSRNFPSMQPQLVLDTAGRKDTANAETDLSNSTSQLSSSATTAAASRPVHDSDDDEIMANMKLLGWDRVPTALTEFERLFLSAPWRNTPLGPIGNWSNALRCTVASMMRNAEPRVIIWGPARTLIYNEASVPIYGKKHPGAMARSMLEVWSEVKEKLSTTLSSVMEGGRYVKISEWEMYLDRHGFKEECYFDSAFLHIPGSDGSGNGALNEFTEISESFIDRRRQQMFLEIKSSLKAAEDLSDLWSRLVGGLKSNVNDIPFAVFYSLPKPKPARSKQTSSQGTTSQDTTSSQDSSSAATSSTAASSIAASSVAPSLIDTSSVATSSFGEHIDGVATATFEASLGLEPEQLHLPRDLTIDGSASTPLEQAIAVAQSSGNLVFLSKQDGTLPDNLEIAVHGRAWNDKINALCVMPVVSSGHGGSSGSGVAILGVNPRQLVDERMEAFFYALQDTFYTMISLSGLPEQSRNQKMLFDELESSLTQRITAHALHSQRLDARFSRMAHCAPIGMYIIGLTGKPVFCNDAYVTLIGTTHAGIQASFDALGFDWWKPLVVPEDRATLETGFQRLVTSATGHSVMEYRVTKIWQSIDQSTGLPISGPTHVRAHSIPEFDEAGNLMHVMGWLVDVSHEKFTQRLLSERLDEAQEAKRQSENFIDMTSHEMRNPLSAILQSADGILTELQESGTRTLGNDTNVTPSSLESIVDAAQTIILCAQHQKRIVDDILTFSKLDSQLLVISPDKARPSLLLDRALRMYNSELERASIKSRVEILPGFINLDLDFVMVDSSRILQVIINLLTNAIKFTQYAAKREITVSLDASLTEPTALADQDVVFIPPRASRPDHQLTAEWGNGQVVYLLFTVQDSGLGLTAEEKNLLFQRFLQASPKTYKQYGGSGLGLFISRELVELQGGRIGVSSEKGKGCSFAFYVKGRQCLPSTPAIRHNNKKLGSPSPQPSESAPASTLQVSGPLNGSASRKPTAETEAGHKAIDHIGDKPKLHVLIVEDNLINQKVMAKQVRTLGHTVHVANHGVEALEFLEQTAFWTSNHLTNGAEQKAIVPLDVVLMDQEMPVMDGVTCIRRIREMERDGTIARHVPVIAVTANARNEQIGILLGSGMDEVVTKPFHIPTVIERATKLLQEMTIDEGWTRHMDGLPVVVEER
ncbi:hypothetical protein MBLNU457_5549t1 [Dothideomycetes sp. NU457]